MTNTTTTNATNRLYWVEEVREHGDSFQDGATFDREAAIDRARLTWSYLTRAERKTTAVYVAFVDYAGTETDPEAAYNDWVDNCFGDYDAIPFLRLVQEAYPINDRFGGVMYEARAVDQDGKNYMVRWDLLPDFDPGEDPEDRPCDWDAPSEVVTAYGDAVADFVLLD